MDSDTKKMDEALAEEAECLWEKASSMLHLDDSYPRDMNRHWMDEARSQKDVKKLKLFVDYLSSGKNHLNALMSLHFALTQHGIDYPVDVIKVPMVDLYQELLFVLRNHYKPLDRKGVLIAAVLSGIENTELLIELIRERRPDFGSDIEVLVESVRDVPSSVMSGAL